MLNTNRLRLLRELSDRKTITAVAEALYLTPPAVSHQLAVLETEVGVPLLERTARSVRLTEAGRRLVEHSHTILAECEAALADVATVGGGVSGDLTLSTFQTAVQTIALPAIRSLARRFGNLSVTCVDAEPVRAEPELKAGVIDVALSHEWDFVPLAEDPALDRVPLMSEPVVALLPAGHPLAAADAVRVGDLAGDSWCVAHETATSRQAIERVAQAAGFEPRIVLESNYFRAIGTAVESGLGVGIAPKMTDLRGIEVVSRPLVEPAMNRRIYAAVRRGSSASPAVAAVLDALKTAADAFMRA